MNFEKKRYLDYLLGGVLILVLKPLAILLGAILRRNHQLTPQGKILFLKVQGGGSLVIAYPALYALRKNLNLKMELVATSSVKQYAEILNVFDAIHIIDDRSMLALLRSSSRALAASFLSDTFVDLEVYSRLSSVFSLISCARNRIGFHFGDVYWKKRLYTHLLFFNRFKGSYYFYDHIANVLGASVRKIDVEHARNAFKNQSSQSLFQINDLEKKNVVAIVSCCSDFGRERMMSSDQWSSALDSCQINKPFFVFLGSAGERDEVNSLISNLLKQSKYEEDSYYNSCGQYTLAEVVNIMRLSRHVYSIDSGLLHLARLLGVSSTSFWGPTDPNTRLRQFDDLKEEVKYGNFICSPCIHVSESSPCNGAAPCMKIFASDTEDPNPYWISRSSS